MLEPDGLGVGVAVKLSEGEGVGEAVVVGLSVGLGVGLDEPVGVGVGELLGFGVCVGLLLQRKGKQLMIIFVTREIDILSMPQSAHA